MQTTHIVASVTLDWLYKIHNLSYFADIMIVLFINLCDSKVLSITTQWKIDSRFALSLDSTATGDSVH